MSEIIKLKNISKTFHSCGEDINILKNLNLTIIRNEIFGIIGTSGSGKSTLLHIMGLMSAPTKGDIIFDNVIYNKLNESKDSLYSNGRKKIGFIYQFHHLLPEFSVKENLNIAQIICGTKESIAEKNSINILEKFNLKYLENRKPCQMSGGENQRIAILRAIVKNPLLILADEPTGNLDQKNSEILFDFLLEVNNEIHSAIVIASHNEALIKKLPKLLDFNDLNNEKFSETGDVK